MAEAVLLPLIAALVLAVFRTRLANAAAALVLLGTVLVVATSGRRAAGIISSLVSATCFDFFLTGPYERIVIASSHDIETTIALMVVGVAVTEIAVEDLKEMLGLADCRFEPTLVRSLRPQLGTNAEVELDGVRYDVDLEGLPGATELAVLHNGSRCGRFVMEPASARPVSIEQRIAALTIADLVGAALSGH